nr:DUF4082 domain-containing protein [Motilibacter deserti]
MGSGFGCGVATSGELACWGTNGFGQLGTRSTAGGTASTPEVVGTGWDSVDVGTYSACAIRSGNGTLWCWGAMGVGYGLLGNGSGGGSTRPVQAGALTGWARVSVTNLSACAVRTDGTRWCWGANETGAFGNGAVSNVPARSPVRADAYTDWLDVRMSLAGGCGLRRAGLYCWGMNPFGSVGAAGAGSTQLTPLLVSREFVEYDFAGNNGCGIKADATLWCWGMGMLNRNGGGDEADAPLPRRLGAGRDWRAVRVTPAYTFAVDSTGTVWAWGGAAAAAGPASGFTQSAYAGLGATPVARLSAPGSATLQPAENTGFALLGAVDWVAGPPVTALPATPAGNATTVPGAAEVGTRFRVTSAQQLVGVRVHRASESVSARTARVWRADGTLLATLSFHPSPVASDGVGSWLYATGTPVDLAPGVDYVVSYTVPAGAQVEAEAGASATPHANGPLTLPPGWGVTGTVPGAMPTGPAPGDAGYAVDPVLLNPVTP